LAGHNCLQLSSLVRHLIIQEGVKPSIVPATGLHSERKHFRRVPSKQGPPTRIFSQFSVFRSACAESGVDPTGRPYCCAYSEQLSALLPPLLITVPMWKTSGNPVGSDD